LTRRSSPVRCRTRSRSSLVASEPPRLSVSPTPPRAAYPRTRSLNQAHLQSRTSRASPRPPRRSIHRVPSTSSPSPSPSPYSHLPSPPLPPPATPSPRALSPVSSSLAPKRRRSHPVPSPTSRRRLRPTERYFLNSRKLNLSTPRARRSRATDASARAPSLSVHPLASIPRPSNERAERADLPTSESFISLKNTKNTLEGFQPQVSPELDSLSRVCANRATGLLRGHLPPGEAWAEGGDSWMSPHSRIVPFSGDPHEKIARDDWMDGQRRRKTDARPFTTRRWRYRARDRAATDRPPRPLDLDDRPPRPPDRPTALDRPRASRVDDGLDRGRAVRDGRTDRRTDGRTERNGPTERPTERTERSLARVRSRVSSTAARARERERDLRFERRSFARSFIHSFHSSSGDERASAREG